MDAQRLAEEPTAVADPSLVLVLAGPLLGAMKLAPAGVRWVACRHEADLADRVRRYVPSAVILEVPAASAAALAATLRRLQPGTAIIVVSGEAGVEAAAEGADFVLAAGEDLPMRVARTLRYALGQAVRGSTRVSTPGRAIVTTGAGATIDLPIVDLSEDGVRVGLVSGLPDESPSELRLAFEHGRDAWVRVEHVRRAEDAEGQSSIAFRFVLLDPAARAVIRSALARGGDAAARPIAPEAVTTVVERLSAPPRPAASAGRSRAIVGRSPSLRRVLDTIDRVAATDVSVLVLGETGTGKELVARAVHEGSTRTHAPFVAVNCAALPENLVESELFGHEPGAFTGATKRKIGRIEQASGGTLFLDEIGDLPAMAQAKLLRALQERVIERIGGAEPIRVDFRLIAATNHDLEAGIAQKSFRRDLFYRLNVVSLALPPLRDRTGDVPLLTDFFMARTMERLGKRSISLNEHARRQMLAYPWPGNIRELENLCTRLVALASSGQVLGPEHLGLLICEDLVDSPLPSTDLRDILDFCEREILKRMLDRNAGNRTRTARDLGMSRQALQQRLAKFRGGPAGEAADGEVVPEADPDATVDLGPKRT